MINLGKIITKNANCLIVGCGISGKSVLKFLQEKSINTYVFDDKEENAIQTSIQYNAKVFNPQQINQIDFAVISPGIKTKHNAHFLIKTLQDNLIHIISDFDIFSFYDKSFHIGITGTNGKSTITHLTNFLINQIGHSSCAIGNIGTPFFDSQETEYKTIELSSYQLENAKHHNLEVSLISNITPDHIEHHGSINNYIKAKEKIFCKNNIINYDDDNLKKIINKIENIKLFSTQEILEHGISVIGNFVYLDGVQYEEFTRPNSLLGEHNGQNIAASLSIINQIQPSKLKTAIQKIKLFVGLEHRNEFIKKIGRISFYNDSKATNPDSTEKAINSFEKNIYLICGGKNKEEGIDKISHLYHKIDNIFLIGEATELFQLQISGKVPTFNCENLEKATKEAYKKALQDIKNNPDKEVTILLSPLCASFDQYKNFEERGSHFKQIVAKF